MIWYSVCNQTGIKIAFFVNRVLFWKLWPEVLLLTACGLTLSKHGSFPSWWKYPSEQCPCVVSESAGVAVGPGASAEHRGQSVRPGVSLSSDVRNHSVSPPSPLTDWSPACGAAFSLDDLHATSRRSSGRRFLTAEHLPVGRCSGARINTQRATSQSESPAGFRPTPEQLTGGTKYDVAIFFSLPSWLRQEERTEDWKLRSWQSYVHLITDWTDLH